MSKTSTCTPSGCEQRRQLLGGGPVGPIGLTDGQRVVVEPEEVAAIAGRRRGEPPHERHAQVLELGSEKRRLPDACGLGPAQLDDARRHDEGRVVDEARVGHVLDRLEDLDEAAEPLEQGREPGVLLLEQVEVEGLCPVRLRVVAARCRRPYGDPAQRRHHRPDAVGLSVAGSVMSRLPPLSMMRRMRSRLFRRMRMNGALPPAVASRKAAASHHGLNGHERQRPRRSRSSAPTRRAAPRRRYDCRPAPVRSGSARLAAAPEGGAQFREPSGQPRNAEPAVRRMTSPTGAA